MVFSDGWEGGTASFTSTILIFSIDLRERSSFISSLVTFTIIISSLALELVMIGLLVVCVMLVVSESFVVELVKLNAVVGAAVLELSTLALFFADMFAMLIDVATAGFFWLF